MKQITHPQRTCVTAIKCSNSSAAAGTLRRCGLVVLPLFRDRATRRLGLASRVTAGCHAFAKGLRSLLNGASGSHRLPQGDTRTRPIFVGDSLTILGQEATSAVQNRVNNRLADKDSMPLLHRLVERLVVFHHAAINDVPNVFVDETPATAEYVEVSRLILL